MTERFFVYGTLKVGGKFASYFDKLRIAVKPAILKDHQLYGIGPKNNPSFPGAIPGKGTIVGEVHEYDKDYAERILSIMDSIEGYYENNKNDSLYIRKKHTVELQNGTSVEAFVYIYNGKIQRHFDKINSGEWKV